MNVVVAWLTGVGRVPVRPAATGGVRSAAVVGMNRKAQQTGRCWRRAGMDGGSGSADDADTRERLDELEERLERLERAVRALAERTEPEGSAEPDREPRPQAETTDQTQGFETVDEGPTPTPGPRTGPEAPPESLEERLGADLLAKAGVLVLVLGLAFAVAWAIESGLIGLTARIVLGIVGGLAVAAAALPFRDSPRYGRLARVFAGGGFGLAYFCAFAAHHFETYQAAIGIGFWTDTVLLTLIAAGVAAYGLYIASPAFLLEALALGLTTAFLAQDYTVFTLAYATLLGLGVAGVAAYLRAPRVVALSLATVYGHAFVTHLAGEDPGLVLGALAVDAALIALFAVAIPRAATLETQGRSEGRTLLYGANAAALVVAGTLVAESGGVLDDGVFALVTGAALAAAAAPAAARSARLATASLLAALGSLLVGSFLALSAVQVVYVWAAGYTVLALLVPLVDRPVLDKTVHGLGVLTALITWTALPEMSAGLERAAALGLVAAAFAVGFVAIKRGRGRAPSEPTRPAVPHIAAGTLALAALLVFELDAWGATVALGAAGVVPVVAGFLADWPEPRWAGLGLFGVALAKAFAVDVWSLDPGLRVLAFVGLGLALVLAAFAYARFLGPGDEAGG